MGNLLPELGLEEAAQYFSGTMPDILATRSAGAYANTLACGVVLFANALIDSDSRSSNLVQSAAGTLKSRSDALTGTAPKARCVTSHNSPTRAYALAEVLTMQRLYLLDLISSNTVLRHIYSCTSARLQSL